MVDQERLIRILDGSVAVRCRGSGPTIVFCHGNSGSSRCFEKQLSSALANSHRLMAIDFPGCGDSAPASLPEHTYTLPGWAAVLVRALAELDAADALVVGWSQGGHIVLEAADQLPRATGFLIFGAPPIASSADFARACYPRPEIAAGFREDSTDEEIQSLLAVFLRSGSPVPDVFVQDFLRADKRTRAIVGASVAEGRFRDEVRVVAELQVPLAILYGADEALIQRGYYDEVPMPTLWRGSVQMVPDAGHAPQWENPAVFNRLLGEFARECFEPK